MSRASCTLTVFFDDPFWVGVVERVEEDRLTAAKVTFGAEPRDQEVYAFLLQHYRSLSFSPPVAAITGEGKRNPKRMKRTAQKQLQRAGVGTRSQQALKLQQEQGKRERREKSRAQKLAEDRQKFEQKQQKKRAKHRGR